MTDKNDASRNIAMTIKYSIALPLNSLTPTRLQVLLKITRYHCLPIRKRKKKKI